MGVNLSSPVIQILDGNGNPGVGYLLYSYEVGTMTPKALYSDEDCTTPLSNPVVMDSRGEAVCYMDGEYKLVATTSTGSVVWSVPNVGTTETTSGTEYVYYPDSLESDHGTTGSGGTLYDIINALAFTNSPATIVFRGPVAGSTLPTVTYGFSTSLDDTAYTNLIYKVEKGAVLNIGTGVSLTTNAVLIADGWQIFSGLGTILGHPGCEAIIPEWWGAVGNGVQDDSTYITRALDHYFQRNNSEGSSGYESVGIFKFLSGKNYKMGTGYSKTLFNNHIGGWQLTGYGAKIQADLSSGYAISITSNATVRNLIVAGLYITGGSSETGLLYLSGGAETSGQYLYCLTVRDLALFGSNGHGLYLQGSIFEGTVKDCNIYLDNDNVTGSGVVFDPGGQNSGQLSLYDVNCYYGLNNFRIANTSYPSFYNCAGHEAYEYAFNLISNNMALINCYAENAWNSASSQATGNAGFYLAGSGTLVNCVGSTNKRMRYAVRIYAAGQINVVGGTGNGTEYYGIINGYSNDQCSINWMSDQTFIENAYGAARTTVHTGNGVRSTYVATSGTSETTLGYITLTSMLQRHSYKLFAYGIASGSATKTLSLYIGATELVIGNFTSTEDWRLEINVYAFGDSQQFISWVLNRASSVTSGTDQLSVDCTGAVTLAIKGTSADAGSAITCFTFMADRIS
jgi:hypothetical protein